MIHWALSPYFCLSPPLSLNDFMPLTLFFFFSPVVLCFSSLSLSLSSFCRYLCLGSSRIQIHHYSSLLLLLPVFIINNAITDTAVPGLSLFSPLSAPAPSFYLLLNPTGRGRWPPNPSPVLLEVSSC